MAKRLTQYQMGNCDGCKYRSKWNSGEGSCCDFYLETGKPFKVDKDGNCIENTSLKNTKDGEN